MVGGGEIVTPHDHFEERLPRGIAHTGHLVPLLLAAADEDEMLLAHPHDPGPDLAEHLHGNRAIALVGFTPAQVLLRLGPVCSVRRLRAILAEIDHPA